MSSLAERRFQFWDAESKRRTLEEWESRELEHNLRLLGWYTIRSQAEPPPPRLKGAKG